jgi:LmbE family N-acetylglucosaminyl deacetylase
MYRAVVGVAPAKLILAGLILAVALPLAAQQNAPGGPRTSARPVPQPAALGAIPLAEPEAFALPLAEDRGAATVEQSLRLLGTTASVLMIVAHPDDEDGPLLTCLSRGLGARVTLLTLTRGEGGQNMMSADEDGALGLIRTNELFQADRFYGATQLWGTEADFGFSKTQEESFAKWGRQRVLYDAVLAVRRVRPQVIVSTFVGGVSDGHGHHQVAGEIAQEVFKAAGDPRVFPEQMKEYGVEPWQPLAVYSMEPFAPITGGKIFDYATGKWAPARFKNYVTGEWTEGALSVDATLDVGALDPALGRSYVQIARQGWGEQKSQNGGANPALSGPATTSYHLWAAVSGARAMAGSGVVSPKAADESLFHNRGDSLFQNRKVKIDTSIAGLALLVKGSPPGWLVSRLDRIASLIQAAETGCSGQNGVAVARKLAPAYRQTLELRNQVASSSLDAESRASLLFELDAKIGEFQAALKDLLGLDLIAFTTKADNTQASSLFRGGSADETPSSVTPGEEFEVRVHAAQATSETRLSRVWLESHSGDPWKAERTTGPLDLSAPAADPVFRMRAAENAASTQPYFTRASIEQPYYDLLQPKDRLRSFAPWPLSAWTEFTFDGLPIRLGQVVQTMERVDGEGGVYEPLVVTPAIGVRIDPETRILPLNGSALPVRVTVHSETAAEGIVALQLPDGWRAQPSEAHFHRTAAGDTEPILFSVTPLAAEAGAYTIDAVARSGGRTYSSGWRSVGYTGLRPYNLFQTARLRTRKVDVKLAAGLRIGYVMGTGDLVPEAIEGLGGAPHLLTATELTTGDLSAWNVIVVGIRAYSARPELTRAQPRLDEFVRRGGTLIVQYQSASFPAPFPLSMGRLPERVVDEDAPVKLLDPANRLLNWPNAITAADFAGWVEERGHSFLDRWSSSYIALTETADPGQDPQRGGLLVAHSGEGTYIYVAYALYRQLPQLVPGAYRLLANLLSAGQNNEAKRNQVQTPRP